MNNPNNATGPKSIDWLEAKKYYLESFSRSYDDVAKKFGVSLTMVESVGSKESWVKVRQELGERGVEEFEKNKILEIGKANTQHLNIARAIQSIAAQFIKANQNNTSFRTSDLKNVADAMEKGVNMERLILGLPTSNTKSEIMGRLQSDLSLSPDDIKDMDAFFKNESQPAPVTPAQ